MEVVQAVADEGVAFGVRGIAAAEAVVHVPGDAEGGRATEGIHRAAGLGAGADEGGAFCLQAVADALLFGPTSADVNLPLAPAPRLVGPSIELEAVPGGYQVRLNRKTARRLQEVLEQTDEKQLAAAIREVARLKDDEVKSAKLQLAAFLMASQMPGFKKSLAENQGPGGVAITITGLQSAEVKTGHPRVDRAFGVLRSISPLLPADTRETIGAIESMARTTPLTWTVEPRK